MLERGASQTAWPPCELNWPRSLGLWG